MEKTKGKKQEEIKKENTKTKCIDSDCPKHGALSARGRVFRGQVTNVFPRRLKIVFERVIFIPKYERYAKKRAKIHARIPECMQHSVNKGDIVLVQECRPLSKIIHHVLTEVMKKA